MIAPLMRLAWTNLKRDRVALLLTFLLPIVFFSIFAGIFGGMGGSDGKFKPLLVVAVDEDRSAISGSLVAALADRQALRVFTTPEATAQLPTPGPWTREAAHREVRGGRAVAAIIIPAGFGADFGSFGDPGESIEIIYDASNPMARFTLTGLLQAAAFSAAPEVLVERGFESLYDFGGGEMTPQQRLAIANLRQQLAEDGDGDGGPAEPAAFVPIEATAARDDKATGQRASMVAYYAAGIGVMFLLFSMSAAAGTLLDDQESGTLERLLASSLSISQLLAGRWLFYTLLGIAQVVLMFVWGALAFGLDLFTVKRLLGFGLMATVTGAAAAAFGLLLATLCTSRAQMSGVSTIVILIMSALGGSMVPRFVMPEFMETLSKFTFNGWALDGFLKVFWYDDPAAGVLSSMLDLWPQLAVLAGVTLVFLALARLFARRWEAA